MTIQFGTAGAAAAGSASLSVPYPASIAAGDLLILVICNKYPTNGPTTPSGFSAPANNQQSGGAGSAGIDAGTVYSTVYTKVAAGTETGNLSVTITSGNSSVGRMFRYTKLSTATWDVALANGSDNSAGAPSWSVTAGSDPGIKSGDMVVVGSAVNADAYTYTSEAIAATGVTFGAAVERQDSGTNTGQDCALFVSEHPATAGTSSAAPVYTATASGSNTNNPAGASVFVRLRELGPITGSEAATTSQAGTLAGDGALAGTIAATASQSAVLAATGALAGTADALTTADGSMAGGVPIFGTADATASQTGEILATGDLAASAAAMAAQTGQLLATGDLAGTSAAASDQTGAVDGNGALAATAAASADQSASVAGEGALVGAAGASAAETATLLGSGELAASADAAADATALLVGAAVLLGQSDAVAAQAGEIVADGALVGQADAAADQTGLLVGAAACAGLAAALAGESGVLAGTGALVGQAAALASQSGLIGLPGEDLAFGTASAFADTLGTLLGFGTLVGAAICSASQSATLLGRTTAVTWGTIGIAGSVAESRQVASTLAGTARIV